MLGWISDSACAGAQEEIEEAARLANAHAFIIALPKGYSTVVSLVVCYPCNDCMDD